MSHKVYIVDDDDAVRTALALLLRSVHQNSETFASAQALLEHVKPPGPDERRCLVTDMRMPGMSGFALLEEMQRRHINIPVIMMSGHGDVPMAVRAMRMGAVSFLQKPVDEQELIDLVNQALAEPPRPGKHRGHNDLQAQRAQLTGRQAEIFDLLMQGLQSKEVARRLGLSPRTIEVHRAHILKRLGAESFAQLIRDFLERSIAD